jgi:Transposase DDE domain
MKNQQNLLVDVAVLALRVSRNYLAAYGHKKSPRRFTQPQLMSCLVLKAYTKNTHRGLVDLLHASETLRGVLGLARVPNYSTLKKFADRVANPQILDALLAEVFKIAGPWASAGEAAALDSTGFSPTPASVYYRGKAGKASRHFVKVSLVVSLPGLLAVSMAVNFGPTSDVKEAGALLWKAERRFIPATLYADKGYDAEWIHVWCREHWGIRSVIPPVIRTLDGTIQTPHRRAMSPCPRDRGRRWGIESFFSGLKRSCGGSLMARRPAALLTEAAMRVLAYTLRR